MLITFASHGVTATEQTTAAGTLTLPAIRVKGDAERVSLLRLYKVAKWDLNVPQTPVYEPDQAEEIVVVRFFRESIKPGADIVPHDVVLIDGANQTLRRNREYWRLSSGKWSEWVFIVPRGTQIKSVVINGTEFATAGYSIPAVKLPIEQ